jgi:hypothetical protein
MVKHTDVHQLAKMLAKMLVAQLAGANVTSVIPKAVVAWTLGVYHECVSDQLTVSDNC